MHGGHRLQLVESDVFNICNRIKEIDPRLVVRLRDGHAKPWVVLEITDDGIERWVAAYEELNASILDDLRYMAAVPLEDRVARVEREIEASNKELEKGMSDETFEKFAWDFNKALRQSNMSDPVWDRSYRPRKPRG